MGTITYVAQVFYMCFVFTCVFIFLLGGVQGDTHTNYSLGELDDYLLQEFDSGKPLMITIQPGRLLNVSIEGKASTFVRLNYTSKVGCR